MSKGKTPRTETVSICTKCEAQNSHEINHDGHAEVICPRCGRTYRVVAVAVVTAGGKRNERTGIKAYSLRVKEPDKDETLLAFMSARDISLKKGDLLTCSYDGNELVYVKNDTLKAFWDVRPPQIPKPTPSDSPKNNASGLGVGCVVLLVLYGAWGLLARRPADNRIPPPAIKQATPEPRPLIKIASGSVNLRGGPGTNYPSIGEIDKDSWAEVY